jgi:hypothetical protein
MMRASAERMIRQTNQLLALARAEPSHFAKTRLEPLDLDRLVADPSSISSSRPPASRSTSASNWRRRVVPATFPAARPGRQPDRQRHALHAGKWRRNSGAAGKPPPGPC